MSVAIITGASSGIGAEFARGYAGRVDELWLVARRREKMVELGERLGVKYKVICADLSVKEGIDTLRRELEECKPTVKYLVNAAGFGDFGGFDEIPEKKVEMMIDLNVKATVLITHMVIPYMERGGRIIQLGSGSCFTPLPYFNTYSSGKVFVLHYTKSLNFEIKKYGLRATCFCPGWVETEFIGKATAAEGITRPRDKAMKPMLKSKRVVRGCIKASDRGRAMYVTNWYTKLQHLLFKILPDPILTHMWLGMLEKQGDKNGK
jgi:short-subunit dehydrogenase